MNQVTNNTTSFQILQKSIELLPKESVLDFNLIKKANSFNISNIMNIPSNIKKSYFELLASDALSNISFSNVLFGLILIILCLATFESFFSKFLTNRIGTFLRQHRLFGILYAINWMFIIVLAISKSKSNFTGLLNVSLDGLKNLIIVLGITAFIMVMGLVFLYIFPFLLKLVLGLVPICIGAFLLHRNPSFSSVCMFITLALFSVLIVFYVDAITESTAKSIKSTAVLILINFPQIFIFNFIMCSVFYLQFNVIKNLFVQSNRDTPYYFYLIFIFFWSKYVIQYISNTFSFSMLAHSVAKQNNCCDIEEYKITRACRVAFDSFGCICFFASLPALFDCVYGLFDSMEYHVVKFFPDSIAFILTNAISILKYIIKAISSLFYCYNVYSLVHISCFGIESVVENSQEKSSSKEPKMKLKFMQFFKNTSSYFPILYFIYSYFFNSNPLFNIDTMVYSFFISYMMIENILSLIEPTLQYIVDGDFLNKKNCVFNSKTLKSNGEIQIDL